MDEQNFFVSKEWKEFLVKQEQKARAFVSQLHAHVFEVAMLNGDHFNISYYVHLDKTVAQWREDIRKFCRSWTEKDDDGRGSDSILNAFNSYMHELDYEEVGDIVADLWQGKVVVESGIARITDDKDQEDWPDGFIGCGLGD